MMQLLCNGTILDLYDNAGLQFTHDNPLFAFDDLKCERTTQFKLPSTPTNDSVLALSRIPAYKGTGMRVKFSAELRAGVVVKSGYLYVSGFDGTDYNAVFVTGDLVGLQAIKDAGSVRNILQYDSTIAWDASNIVNANAQTLPNIGIVRYMGGNNISVSLRWLMEQAAATIGATINYLHPQADDRQRLLQMANYKLDETLVYLHNDPDASQDPVNLSTFLGLCQLVGVSAYSWQVTAINGSGGLEWDLDNAQLLGRQQFYQIQLPYDFAIEFPVDFPDDLCIVSGNLMADSNGNCRDQLVFFGSRRFYTDANNAVYYLGVPLAGQRIEIPANTPFMLCNGAGLSVPTPTTLGETGQIEFDADDVREYNEPVKISIDHEFVVGENVPVNAILPDLTLVELLRIYASITGTVLNYSNGAVSFEDLDFSTYASRADVNLTKRSSVDRKFSNYAQRNLVSFDSGVVPEVFKLRNVYTIDNVNLEEEKELQTIPCSEGAAAWGYIGDEYEQFLYQTGEDEAITVANAETNAINMQRVTLPKNTGLQALCTASTQIKCTLRMNLAQYNAITEKTLLIIDNVTYIWTSRSWQKEEAQFTLAKVPQ